MLKEDLKNRWYAAALCFSILPLLTGCGIYAVWLTTRSEGLAFIGLLLTPFCLLSLLAGFICLFPAASSFKKNNAPRRKRKILLVLAILLANFLAAGEMAIQADYYYSLTSVKITNNTNVEISDLKFIDPRGNVITVPPVAPRRVTKHRFSFMGEGEVTYSLTSPAGKQQGIFIGYTSVTMVPSTFITINTDGSVEVGEFTALEGPY